MPRHPVFSSLVCHLWDTMPRQRSLPLLPREAEDLPRGERHFKHVPPLTYLIYLSKRIILVRLDFRFATGWLCEEPDPHRI